MFAKAAHKVAKRLGLASKPNATEKDESSHSTRSCSYAPTGDDAASRVSIDSFRSHDARVSRQTDQSAALALHTEVDMGFSAKPKEGTLMSARTPIGIRPVEGADLSSSTGRDADAIRPVTASQANTTETDLPSSDVDALRPMASQTSKFRAAVTLPPLPALRKETLPSPGPSSVRGIASPRAQLVSPRTQFPPMWPAYSAQTDSTLTPAHTIHNTILELLEAEGVFSIIASGCVSKAWDYTETKTLLVLGDTRMFDCKRYVVDQMSPIDYVGEHKTPMALLKMATLLRGKSPHLSTLTKLIVSYGQIQDKVRSWASNGFQHNANIPGVENLINQIANDALEGPVKHIASVTGTKYEALLFVQSNSKAVVKGLCPRRHTLVMQFVDFLGRLVDEKCITIDKEGRFERLVKITGRDHAFISTVDAVEEEEEYYE